MGVAAGWRRDPVCGAAILWSQSGRIGKLARFGFDSSCMSTKPVIGVPACRKMIDIHPFHVVGEKYLQALIDGADALPLIIPVMADDLEIDLGGGGISDAALPQVGRDELIPEEDQEDLKLAVVQSLTSLSLS